MPLRDREMIGWKEFVSFPEWNVKGIEAKVDTGACVSAIHVEDVVKVKGGRVRFHLVTSAKRPFKHVLVRADVVRRTRIRSSTGHLQERFVVATTVRIGTVTKRIEMSLVGRDKMRCRMLLGRAALDGFLIDATRTHIFKRKKDRASREESTK